MPVQIDLLSLANVTVTAPAGCGKTELIADALRRYTGSKPILVLTHTNAGVAALRGRLNRAKVPNSSYRLSTIDAWMIRLISFFPSRSHLDPSLLTRSNSDYPAIRAAALCLLTGQHVHDVLAASYAKLIIDEYQDCTVLQHELTCLISEIIPTVLLGDPMQAIFAWPGNEIPDWNAVVCERFPVAETLDTPWRWKIAGTEGYGRWLLEVRQQLEVGAAIDLGTAPTELVRLELHGTEDDCSAMRLAAANTKTNAQEKVMIVGQSRDPENRNWIARHTPGATVVETAELRDLVTFAQHLNFLLPHVALDRIVRYAARLMTSVEPDSMLDRVASLRLGTAETGPSETELAALNFLDAPTPANAAVIIAKIKASPGVRVFRAGLLEATFRALSQCNAKAGSRFADNAVLVREQSRRTGRPLAQRSVGSTLLLKGLEAEVAVILYADDMDSRNLYVALTRGSKRVVVCSRAQVLP